MHSFRIFSRKKKDKSSENGVISPSTSGIPHSFSAGNGFDIAIK